MTVENFQNALQALWQREPFRPFIVEFVRGDRCSVDFRDALAYRGGVATFIGAGGVPVLFDHESVSQLIGESNRAA